MAVGYIVGFSDMAAEDTAQLGGKAAGLARLTRLGARVPPGFSVSVAAFQQWLDSTGNRAHFGQLFDGRKHSGEGASGLEQAFAPLLDKATVPDDVAEDVVGAYRDLGRRLGSADLKVAVRSSATGEDSSAVSFAGEYETYLDVEGEQNVIDSVARCWRSCFHERLLSYLLAQDLPLANVGMAVVIQAMVPAAKAGVLFTLSPVTGDRSRIVIEASWGLGTAVVGGDVTPDRFSVDKVSLAVLSRDIADKAVEHGPGGLPRDVEDGRRFAACLADHEIVELATVGKRLEKAHGHPLDIEWAADQRLPFPNNLVLLQCRPETVWSQRKRSSAHDATAPAMEWIAAHLTRGTT